MVVPPGRLSASGGKRPPAVVTRAIEMVLHDATKRSAAGAVAEERQAKFGRSSHDAAILGCAAAGLVLQSLCSDYGEFDLLQIH
jgi:hypothetical protein